MSMTRLQAVILVCTGLVCLGGAQPGGAGRQGAQQSQPQGDQPAQQPTDTPAQPPTTFRGRIDFIRVDAFVTDRGGRAVTDLKQADFEVTEDGKPQKIEQFEVIKIDGPRPGDQFEQVSRLRTPDDEEREAARDDVRVFVIFLDEYHVRDRNAPAARAALTRFIENDLRPLDMLAVMYPLTPASDVFFTRDHQSVIRALQRFEGVKYKYIARNSVEREIEREPPSVIETVRNQIVYSAIDALTYRLGGLRDGRKSVIFVSEGFTTLLPPQMRRPLGTPGASTPVSDPAIEREAMEQEEMRLEGRMRDIYKAANRNNTAFYPLDPRGLAVFEFDINDGAAAAGPVIDQGTDARTLRSTQETLRNLAVETGGRAIINRNSMAEGLADMVRDASNYYLIGYTTQTPPDGKFHNIKVRVKRSGVEVRARNGYWAFTPDDVKRMNAPKVTVAQPIQQALASIAVPVQAARFVRTWVGAERGEGGKTRITLVWEPLPLQPNVRSEQAGRVTLLAIDAQGAQVFRGRSPEGASPSAAVVVPPAGTAPGRAAAPPPSGPVGPQRIAFDAPPGKLEMRLRVEGAAGGTLDDETRTIDVPDLTTPQARLSTPRVFRSRNAREFQAAVADAAAVPTATREFSRTERLLIRFDAYAPGSEKPAPAAALLSRAGQKIADVPVAAATGGGTHQIDLSLNTMAAGEYVIEITLKDATGSEAKELIALRVGA
jgi:VWFA-related protein